MAIPTPVNGQITDAVTQANISVLANAPAQAIGSLFQASSHALSLSLENATANQQHMNDVSAAVVTACVKSLIGGSWQMDQKSGVNSVINEAVEAINSANLDGDPEFSKALLYQAVSHSLGLALQNAVAQQQQQYILRNAITTAAAKSLIESNPEEAIKFAKESLSDDGIRNTIQQLTGVFEEIQAKLTPVETKGSPAGDCNEPG